MQFFCFKQISKYDTCFFMHFKGLFRNVVFRSVALVTKKLQAILYFFSQTVLFSALYPTLLGQNTTEGGAKRPPPACLGLMQGPLDCYQFFRTFRTFAWRPLSRRTRIWSSIQQRILFSIYIWINVIHERYLFI